MKKTTRRVVPAFLSLAMTVTSVPGAAFGAPLVTVFSLDGEDTQMVSDPETVFINSYDGAVRSQDFNSNWKFFLGEAGNAQDVNFDDSKWRSVNLPHDYSIEQDYSTNMEAESGYLPGGTGWYRKNFTVPVEAADKQVRIDFDGVYMNATVYINGKQVGTHPYGYSPFSFDLTPYLNYGGDNVIAVKVDHKTPSSRWYSGSGIYRDVKLTMTPMVHEALNGTKIELPGLKENHSGNVAVHVETAVQNESAEDEEVTVSHVIYAKDDESKTPIGTFTAEPVKVGSGETVTVASDMTASNPELWDLDNPQLYVMETKISTGGGISDVTTSDFGFRYIEFNNKSGFYLNGEPVKLKGVCMHHDQGSLGSEAWDRAIERQVEILQEMGCNAIRVTHNPAAKDLIDICNEKGMLVIEEMFDGWHGAKNGNNQDYAKWYGQNIESENQILGKTSDSMTWAEFDLKSVIQRDWNAPSVISWSLGNEVMEGISIGVGDYPNQAKKLIAWATETDDTRPVTTGDNKLKAGWNEAKQIGNSLTEAGGLVGFNYTTLAEGNGLDKYHKDYPDWIIYGSETASSVNSRGVYNPSLYDRQLTAYDESCVGWGHLASQAWYNTIQKDYVAGEFVWTGFDYIGEPTNWNGTGSGAVGNWPSPKNSYFGIVDTAGLPKDSYYLYQSLWNEEVNTLHILPAWNEEVLQKDNSNNVKVVVYSDAPSVELFFTPANGGEKKSLGEKKMTEKHSVADDGGEGLYTYQMYEGSDKDGTAHKNLYRTWKVPYEDGTLTAVAKDESGRVIENTEGRSSVTTAGKADKLEAFADRDEIRADGKDLSYITVKVTDKDGNMVPDAQNRVKFTVEGNGKLVGVDNGWTTDHDSYQADNRRAFNGELVAIVQSTQEEGSFTVTASADGLDSCTVTVDTEAVEAETPEPGDENEIVSYKLSKNYYVKVGYEPQLPEELTVTCADGEEKSLKVVWDTIPQDKLDEEGSFVLTGDMEGTKVTVSINMINQIAAILNYSTTVHVGEKPILPESRQIVSEEGEILNIALPIEWDALEADAYNEIGIVKVKGTAEVFGEPMEVTASVRVQEEEAVVTDNVGTKAKVEQNISEEQHSDTLAAVNDGKTASVDNPNGGDNTSRWSNWNYTKLTDNNPPAELTFTFDTQETLGQIKIYFVRDSSSLRFPDKGKTKIYISNDKEEWTELHTLGMTEEIPEQETSSMVKCYTYEFAPVGATYIKFEIHNNDKGSEGAAGAAMPTTGITEIELYRSEGKFVTNSSTELSRLSINGVEAPASALTAGEYSTPMSVVEEIEAESADNAAVTILPAYEKEVKIITEAEDHSRQDEFIIHLDQESTGAADDASEDYPVEDMKATAGNERTEQPASNVLDGNASTLWHTDWNSVTPLDKRWIKLELEEETLVGALRYQPRQGTGSGDNNGRVKEYKVEVSSDDKSWTTVSEGTWEDSGDWKIAEFTEPVKAKYVKLTGVHTVGDAADKFMSAAEIRIRKGRETTKLTEDNVTLAEDMYIMEEDGTPVEPEVTVTVDGKALRYGIDYTVNYENNDKPGIATAVVKGIMNYSGTIRKDFRIVGENTQNVTVVNGTITKLEDQEYTGGSQAETESGRVVTVKADEKEGMEFDHWRTAPTSLLSAEQQKQSEVTFTVPESSSRLSAVYREEGKNKVEKEAYSTATPETWFAYADEEGMEELLEASLTTQDEIAIRRGATVEVEMNLEYSKKEPSKMDVLKSYQLKASPSDAAEEEEEDKTVLPEAEEESDKAVLPETEGESDKAVLPEVEGESDKAVLPEVEEESDKAVLPEVEGESDKAVLPKVEEESDKAVLPEVEEESDKAVLPEVEEESDKAVLPEVEEESDKAVLPEVEEESGKAVLPETEEESDKAVLPAPELDKAEPSADDGADKPERSEAAKKATPSNAAEKAESTGTSAALRDPRAILKSEVLSPLKAVKEEAGLDGDDETAKQTKFGFWIRSQATKTVKRGNSTESTKLYDPSLPEVQVKAELPKADRRMEDYQVMRYEYDENGTSVSAVDCALEGNNLVFDASVDGIYAVMYTQCFDVVFQDYDKTVLKKQRVAYGNAAEAPEDPKREGYIFTGWDKEFDYVTSDMVITAEYEPGEEQPEVNKNRLEAKIAEIRQKMAGLDEEDYTEESWSRLEEALDEAVSVFEDEDASQKEVNKATENLDKAYKSLKKKPAEPTDPEEPEKPENGGSSGGHHSGGGGSSHSGGGYFYAGQKAVPLAGGAYVTNGSWNDAAGSWTFTKENGEKAVSTWIYTLWGDSYEWYYFGQDGFMTTGWIDVDGQTFYLNPVSDGTRGKMVTGWQLIDGTYYYFNPVSDGSRGALLRNTTTPDGYQVGADGAWIQ